MASKTTEFINYYKNSIEKSQTDLDRIVHCLKKLDSIRVHLDHLRNTGIGRTVGVLRGINGEVADLANKLVDKWMRVVEKEGKELEQRLKSSPNELSKDDKDKKIDESSKIIQNNDSKTRINTSSSSTSSRKRSIDEASLDINANEIKPKKLKSESIEQKEIKKSTKKSSKTKNSAVLTEIDGNNCNIGFAEALMMFEQQSKRQSVNKNVSARSSLSSNSSNTSIKSLPKIQAPVIAKTSRKVNENDNSEFFSSKTNRTKVFSGNSKTRMQIPSLFDKCVKFLHENIDLLGATGGVPFSTLQPVLQKAKPEQLSAIEYYNPYLLEDSDVLWKSHCQRKWRQKQPAEMESWREMFDRCNKEDEEKLSRLTRNIKQNQQISYSGIQKAKMAFVDSVAKPPRGVAVKKQEPVKKFTSVPISDTKLRISVSLPRNEKQTGKSNTQKTNATKKAPLMAKILKKFKR